MTTQSILNNLVSSIHLYTDIFFAVHLNNDAKQYTSELRGKISKVQVQNARIDYVDHFKLLSSVLLKNKHERKCVIFLITCVL